MDSTGDSSISDDLFEAGEKQQRLEKSLYSYVAKGDLDKRLLLGVMTGKPKL